MIAVATQCDFNKHGRLKWKWRPYIRTRNFALSLFRRTYWLQWCTYPDPDPEILDSLHQKINEIMCHTGDDMHNLPEEHGSVLFRLLTYPDGVPLENLSTDALQVLHHYLVIFILVTGLYYCEKVYAVHACVSVYSLCYCWSECLVL